MKKVFIEVQTQFEATHRYPEAPEQVAHLRNTHRHTFIITAQIEVKGLNRELEFYMVKDYLDDVAHNVLSLSSKSCEMIGDDIYNALSQKYGRNREMIIKVSEDNQRSSISYYEAASKTNCIVVVGRIGSGKTVISKELAKRLNYKFIEVSDIVKEMTGRGRDTIRLNKLTGQEVAEKLITKINDNYDYVISGVRQPEILEELKKYYNVVLVKLDLWEDIRIKRVNIREECSLEKLRESDALDSELGLDKIMRESSIVLYGDSSLKDNVKFILDDLKEVL